MTYDCSVIVVTYNSDLKKLQSTLLSIIEQKNVSVQIIISDDGSEKFEKELLEKWLSKYMIQNYKIIISKTNTGTVRNVLRGVNEAEAEFVKLLSPGDLFYDENSLYKIICLMKKRKIKIAFGKGCYYSYKQNNIKLYNIYNPKDLQPYKNINQKQIEKNYLLYKDYVLGALFVIEKQVLLNYLNKIVNLIIFAEDCSVIMMVADGLSIGLLDEFFIWYEYGSGISTNGSSVWQKRIENDVENCFKLLYNSNGKYKNIFAWHLGTRKPQYVYYKLLCKLHKFKMSIDSLINNVDYTKDVDIEFLKRYLKIRGE